MTDHAANLTISLNDLIKVDEVDERSVALAVRQIAGWIARFRDPDASTGVHAKLLFDLETVADDWAEDHNA